ncbi:MAG: ribonuclease HI [Thermodesulfobacteriota bacterium]
MTTDAPGWKRMVFKNNKVWVETDPTGEPLVQDGRVRIKYQLEQTHEYRVHKESLSPLSVLENAPPTPVPDRPKSTPRKKPGTSPENRGIERPADAICVFTDGAASGNPGPAGIGVLLVYKEKEKRISRFIGHATNNIAELKAIEAGLLEIKNRNLPVRLFTDSAYAFGVLTLGWKAQKNTELVVSIRKTMQAFKDLRLIKVKGHAGVPENETADFLATEAIRTAGQ